MAVDRIHIHNFQGNLDKFRSLALGSRKTLLIKKSQQHPVFPSGLPSKYYPGPMLLNFSDQTRTGVFNMVWPLTRKRVNNCLLKLLAQSEAEQKREKNYSVHSHSVLK